MGIDQEETGTENGLSNGEVADQCSHLADSLLFLARTIRKSISEKLSEVGVTYGQARMLRAVSECESPPRMTEVASLLEVVPRSATSMVDALEEAGLILRIPDRADRRSTFVELTQTGRELLVHLDAARHSSSVILFEPLGESRRRALMELLDEAKTHSWNGPKGSVTLGLLPQKEGNR
jgi:DNA-binding MarR family transcriptional regulator